MEALLVDGKDQQVRAEAIISATMMRVDALVPSVADDSDVATMLGGVTRSAVLRYALLEGVKILEKRYRDGGGK